MITLNKKQLFLFLVSVWLIMTPSTEGQKEEPVLDERIMKLIVESAKLSALTFDDASMYATGQENENGFAQYEHPDYEFISFYTDEPDQAIVAKSMDGHCFLAFRGTTWVLDDWIQNIELGSVDIYKDNNVTSGESCSAREGLADFLSSDLVQQGAQDLMECASTCSDPDDCMILTGHSQGGAISTLALILLYSFNPLLITFGQPLAVSRNCSLIRSERVYRFVNSVVMENNNGESYIAYDATPLLPVPGQDRGHYGYFLLLGEDTAALKLLGIDDDDSGFNPGIRLSTVPHKMAGDSDISYQARVMALYDNGVFPVSIHGFSAGVPCDENNPLLCASDDCGSGDSRSTVAVCAAVPTPAPSAMPTTAEATSDIHIPTITLSALGGFNVNMMAAVMSTLVLGGLISLFLLL